MLYLPTCLTLSRHHARPNVLCTFTIYRTNSCPYGLIVSGKDDAHADEEPKDKKKKKESDICVTEVAAL